MTAVEQRLEAEKREHQKTHDRLREEEKKNGHMRGVIGAIAKDLKDAETMLHRIADQIDTEFPREKKK